VYCVCTSPHIPRIFFNITKKQFDYINFREKKYEKEKKKKSGSAGVVRIEKDKGDGRGKRGDIIGTTVIDRTDDRRL